MEWIEYSLVYTADLIQKFDSKSNRTADSIRDSIRTQKTIRRSLHYGSMWSEVEIRRQRASTLHGDYTVRRANISEMWMLTWHRTNSVHWSWNLELRECPQLCYLCYYYFIITITFCQSSVSEIWNMQWTSRCLLYILTTLPLVFTGVCGHIRQLHLQSMTGHEPHCWPVSVLC